MGPNLMCFQPRQFTEEPSVVALSVWVLQIAEYKKDHLSEFPSETDRRTSRCPSCALPPAPDLGKDTRGGPLPPLPEATTRRFAAISAKCGHAGH